MAGTSRLDYHMSELTHCYSTELNTSSSSSFYPTKSVPRPRRVSFASIEAQGTSFPSSI
jgi:hypothetical protein